MHMQYLTLTPFPFLTVTYFQNANVKKERHADKNGRERKVTKGLPFC